ncbi:hypothetical protein AYO46_07670 [Betaproteobacteria bacterium SCGC AG-212-J23]|nr:hypothetical protein AYO46_07670 [Betaproteobacteria bacterium SCGC AG-212-J23]
MQTVRLLAAALTMVSLQCAAAPFGLQVGDVRLGFDVPAGFADALPSGSPRLQDLAESFTPATNRILVFALSDADMRRFNAGDAPELKSYLLAVTPRALEQDRMSLQAFERYVRDGLRGLGKPIEGDFTKVLETRPMGEAVVIAELLTDPDAAAVLRAIRIPPPEGLFSYFKPSQYVLSSSAVILLRGKALTLSLTSGYESKADIDAMRTVMLRWIDDLRRLNAVK